MEVEIHGVEERHLSKILEWRNSDLIRNVSFNKALITPEVHKKWFEKAISENSQIHWIININGVDAGYAAIKNIDLVNRRCEFASLYIGEERFLLSGAGAVAEFEVLNYLYEKFPNLNKIYCEVLGSNPKVVKLHKRFGFVIEGELHQHYLIENRFDSVLLLALFKDTWEKNKISLQKILKK